ncbi:MAG: hypothetical protein WCA39_05115 [Nitrososphaeraceae archaeon]
MRGSLPNPKPIDMKLNSVTQEVTRAKLSVLRRNSRKKNYISNGGFYKKIQCGSPKRQNQTIKRKLMDNIRIYYSNEKRNQSKA